MLLTKTAIVKWHPNNKKWYELKGYPYTKVGKEFLVKVNDLTKGSEILVNVECDCCGKELKNIQWNTYLKCVHEDGKYYCKKCALKLYGINNQRKTNLKKSQSFKQWCIDNNYQDILDRWDYDLNRIKPDEILFGTPKKYYFKCPRNIHKSELKQINNFTNGRINSIKCKKCNSFAQFGIDNTDGDFLDKYWDYEKNTVNPWEISYSCGKKVYIKCQEKDYHGSYPIQCNNFINGNRCSFCNSKGDKVHPLDSLGKSLEDKGLLHLWPDKNKKSPFKYTSNSGQIVYWKCPDGIHKDYKREICNSNIYDFRCPECSKELQESILQEKVKKYINNIYNFTLLHEYNCTITCINPKTKYILPYDNEIKELKLIIEVHGEQHYKIVSWHKSKAKHNNTSPEQELHKRKLYDRYKRIFAKSKINNYRYLEIPYYTDDKDETWKKLIDDKINEINEIKYIVQQNKSA